MRGEERKLIKFSNYSLCVTLPKSVVTQLKWKKGDIVRLIINEKTKEIVISKNKQKQDKKIPNTDHNIQKNKQEIAKTEAKSRW